MMNILMFHRNVTLEYIIGGVFYIIKYTVGEGSPMQTLILKSLALEGTKEQDTMVT